MKMETATKNEWRETTLGAEGVQLQHGYTFSSGDLSPDGELPVVRIGNVQRGQIVIDDDVRYAGSLTAIQLSKQLISYGDLLMALTGGDESNLATATGRVGRYGIKEPALLNQRVAKVLPSASVDASFLFYLLQQSSITRHLAATANGSVQRNLTNGHVLGLDVALPSLDEQRSIAAVLSSLDDKIELLRRQNETLEQVVRVIFNEWFRESGAVEVERLSDYVDHIRIQVVPSDTSTSVFSHYSIPAFDAGKTVTRELGSQILSGKYCVSPHSILFSKLNPATPRIWAVFSTPDNAVCSTEFQVFKPKKLDDFGFVYATLKFSEYARELANKVQGTSSSHQRLKPEDILAIEFPKPSEEIKRLFRSTAYPLLQKIEANENQVRSLSSIRDTLLPRLMSGEIRV